jgi:hypothetical protein
VPLARLLSVLPLVALDFHQASPSVDGSFSQRRATGRQPLHATTDPPVFHGRGSLGYLSAVAGYTTKMNIIAEGTRGKLVPWVWA